MAGSYSAAFRTKMVQRLVGPKAVSANQLSQEVGIHQSTLSRWLRDAQPSDMGISKGTEQKPPPTAATKQAPARRFSADEKVRIVFAAEGLAGEDLGALLRREGVHDAELATLAALAVALALAREAISAGYPAEPDPLCPRTYAADVVLHQLAALDGALTRYRAALDGDEQLLASIF